MSTFFNRLGTFSVCSATNMPSLKYFMDSLRWPHYRCDGNSEVRFVHRCHKYKMNTPHYISTRRNHPASEAICSSSPPAARRRSCRMQSLCVHTRVVIIVSEAVDKLTPLIHYTSADADKSMFSRREAVH